MTAKGSDGREPLLTTERLIVRRFTAADVPALHAYRNDPDVARWQGWPVPYSNEAAARLVATMAGGELFRPGTWTQLAVQRRDSPGLIGDIGVRMEATQPEAELGFTFARAIWHRGYATEALDAVVWHLFITRGLAQVTASTSAVNEAAQRLLERVGFTLARTKGDDLVYVRPPESAPADPDL